MIAFLHALSVLQHPPARFVPAAARVPAPAVTSFDSVHSFLRAGEAQPLKRSLGSEDGISCYIMGGHVQMRVKDSRVNQVAPRHLTLAQVEFRTWFSLTGFGTYEGTGWFQRSDVLRSDEGVRHTWAKVNKEALSMPVYAPAFPGAPGALNNWTQLVEMVLDLHNTGKLPGFISTGAWPSDDALVFPTLAAVRDANLKALKRTLAPAACCLLPAACLGAEVPTWLLVAINLQCILLVHVCRLSAI